MKNRNQKKQIKADVDHLNAMLENAQKLHDKGYDIATTGYLIQQIQDWIDELQELL